MKILLICLILCVTSVTCQVLKKIVNDLRTIGQLIVDVTLGLANSVQKAIIPNSNPSRRTDSEPKYWFNSNNIPAMSPSLKEPEPIEYKQLKKHPTALLTTDRLISYHGWRPETHQIYTADGYGLTLHRIIQTSDSTTNRTILLHHGLLGSSADWVMLGVKSLPYLLNDAGYDVWMTNARGNYYSQHHNRLQINSTEFWNFSWQEMGQHDLPAVIDYIRKVKGNQDKIDFIGHSMGASALLVLLSTSQSYNNYLRMGVLLAPLAFMTGLRGPLQEIVKANLTSSSKFLNSMDGEYFQRRKMPINLVKQYCKGHRLYCHNPLFFLTGGLHYDSPLNRNRDFLATLLSHVPAGGSIRTIHHYVKIAQSGRFHWYNDIHKEFPLGDIKVPLALFNSNEDKLSSVADSRKVFVNIANPIQHVVFYGQNVTHTEFVWGHRANELIFSKLLTLLKDFNPKNM